MNNKAKRNLKKVIVGGLVALSLTVHIPTNVKTEVVGDSTTTTLSIDPPGA